MLVCSSLLLLSAGSAAFAQSGVRPGDTTQAPSQSDAQAKSAAESQAKSPAKSPEKIKAIRERATQYLAQCMQDWEQATHMTRQEWSRTCRRVAEERMKFLLSQDE
jgi:hypothetical protein